VSPGRILRDVKQKLSDFASSSKENNVVVLSPARAHAKAAPMDKAAAGSGGAVGAGVGVGAAKPPLAKAIYSDASAEIADIDSRLLALQNFLRDAKGAA